LLLEAGLFDEILLRGQDVDLAWRIHRAGRRLVYAPEAVVRHRNERTIWGLVHEGYVHGRGGIRLTEKHAPGRAPARGQLRRIGARLLADLRQVARGDDRVSGLLGLLFDGGKSAGELEMLAQRAVRSRVRSDSQPSRVSVEAERR
jgi:hypothetical protein